MELGERLRQARLEAGLSQRQLCGDAITRNMLSLIESGKASPSMATLQYLSARLGKSVGYFLEEKGEICRNAACMEAARNAFSQKNWAALRKSLDEYDAHDTLMDEEKRYLCAACDLALGGAALERGDALGAVPILENVDRGSIYYREDMERQRRQLLSRGYELLEQYYKEREDFRQAYFYACKRR